MLRSLKHLLEFALLRVVVLGVDLLPLGATTALARTLAAFAFRLDGRRRRTAIENIEKAGVLKSGESAEELAKLSSAHFATVLVETLKARKLLGDSEAVLDFEIPKATRELLENPECGVLMVSGHFGNWEIGAQAFTQFKPVVAAARRVSNPYLDRLLQRRKPTDRFRLVPEWFGSPTRFTDALKAGKAVALLVDLDARGEGMKIDFFGRPAATHVTIPMLHLVTKAPVVFASCVRMEPRRFRIVLSEVIEHRASGDKKLDQRLILEDLNRRLEAVVRLQPDQYLWAHSRWKHGEWVAPEGFVPVSGRLGQNLARAEGSNGEQS